MDVTREMVRQTAELARLEVPAAEEDRMQEALQQMLYYMECLEGCAAAETDPGTVTLQQLREDVVEASLSAEQLMEHSPFQMGFWTPREGTR